MDLDMQKLINRLQRNEEGAAMVEYAVIMAVVLIVAVGALQAVGGGVNAVFQAVQAILPAVA